MKWKVKEGRKRAFIVLLVLCGAFNLHAQKISKNLSDFKEVKTFNAVEVVVIPSEKNYIEITGHSKEKVKFDIVEDRLEIRMSFDNIWSKDNTLIKVYGRSIETIDANEASLVQVDGILEGEEKTFRAQEGARILARVAAKKVISKAISGGLLEIEGKAETQEVQINSGGQYFGKNLRTRETVISCTTAGRGEIYATNYCKATAKLAGTIEIFGRPNEVDQKTVLGGKIF